MAWSAPAMAALILLEMALSAWERTHSYNWPDTGTNLLFTSLNFGLDFVVRGLALGALIFFFGLSPMRWAHQGWGYWVALFLAQDLAYYTLHYADHHVRLFWAVHVTHHNSEKFNLTVAIRSSVFQPIYRFAFYIPLALVGFEPMHILVMYAFCQAYGFWVHTERIGKLWAPIEWIMVTPSHHRVHHASNVAYLDRNMGMVLIIWDRLFGTFTPETERPVYGLTYPLAGLSAGELLFGEWAKLLADLRRPLPLRTRLAYALSPPGWSHDGSTLTSAQLRTAERVEPQHVADQREIAVA